MFLQSVFDKSISKVIGIVYGKVKRYLQLTAHRRSWRSANAHNRTIASTFFPIEKVIVGKHSYGDLYIISFGEKNEGLEIGHFVSIAAGVKFLLGGNHFYKRFTTYPFRAKFEDVHFVETWSKGKIIVEDDVWFGTEAFIMPGVKIGKGAIIGARAVVAADVPAYAIVTGNPARVVKYRFEPEVISILMKIDFSLFEPADILACKEIYEKENDFSALTAMIGKGSHNP
jgi:acetyltransferase-like isoleucine patch superfamily enzyme